MNLLHLQYFYVVAKEGSFSKASQSVKVNQPALSRMVKQLESALDVTLLERQPRGVRLTPEGQHIYQFASEIFAKVDELKRHTGELSAVCKGEFRLGASDIIAQAFLSEVVAELIDVWPQLYPVVLTGSPKEILTDIVSGGLEFGLFFHIPTLPVSLAVTKRWPVRFHLVGASKYKKDKSVLSRFVGSREVDDNFNRRFPTLEKWQRTIPEAKIAVSSNSLAFHLKLVEKGVGVSVLPEVMVRKGLRSGQLVDLLPKEDLVFDLKLVQRKSVDLSYNAKALLGELDKNLVCL